jgi:cell division septation protein DedD
VLSHHFDEKPAQSESKEKRTASVDKGPIVRNNSKISPTVATDTSEHAKYEIEHTIKASKLDLGSTNNYTPPSLNKAHPINDKKTQFIVLLILQR